MSTRMVRFAMVEFSLILNYLASIPSRGRRLGDDEAGDRNPALYTTESPAQRPLIWQGKS
jgi:hypothetical protein